jgi:hypothetical protein
MRRWSPLARSVPRPLRLRSGLIGDGSIPLPGEISLAHDRALFLDELPEFKRPVPGATTDFVGTRRMMRQPREEGQLTISRATASLTYPARCTLAGAVYPWVSGCVDTCGAQSGSAVRKGLRQNAKTQRIEPEGYLAAPLCGSASPHSAGDLSALQQREGRRKPLTLAIEEMRTS